MIKTARILMVGFWLSCSSSLFSQYVLLSKPTVKFEPDGGVGLSSSAEVYDIVSGSGKLRATDGLVDALVFLKKAYGGRYDCQIVLDSGAVSEPVYKYLWAKDGVVKFDSNELIRRVSALIASPKEGTPGKYYILSRLSVLAGGDSKFDKFLVDEFFSFKDMQFVRSVVPVLCVNSHSFIERFIKEKSIDEDVFISVLKFIPYDSSSRGIFLSALTSRNDRLTYEALNKLRGVADEFIISSARDAVLHGSPRSQWAAFMCLSTALKLPIDSPSLVAYEKAPEIYFKKLSDRLMK